MKPATPLGTIVGGMQTVDARTGAPAFTLDVVDLDRGEIARIPLSFLAHGFTVDPRRRHVAVVFEKKGPGAALVDLAQKKLLGHVTTHKERAFYGHGAFAPAGDAVYVVETSLATKEGVVTVRDPDTFKVLGTFPTFGRSPHDCVLVDDGKTLVVTNGGGAGAGASGDGGGGRSGASGDGGGRSGPSGEGGGGGRSGPSGEGGGGAARGGPSVAFIDVATRTLREAIAIPNDAGDPEINAGHVAVGANGDVAVSSAPRDGLPETTSLGGVTLRPAGGAATRMRAPADVVARMRGESLSVCLDEAARVAVVTNPHGNVVTFWSLAPTVALVGVLDVVFPRGVLLAPDGAHVIVTHGKDARVSLVDLATRALVPDVDLGDRRLSGSHVHRWEK